MVKIVLCTSLINTFFHNLIIMKKSFVTLFVTLELAFLSVNSTTFIENWPDKFLQGLKLFWEKINGKNNREIH